MCAVEKGFGALGEERRGGVGVREERREDTGGGGIGEGGQCRRGCHPGGRYFGMSVTDNYRNYIMFTKIVRPK